MNRDQDIQHECKLNAADAARTIAEVEAAVGALLATLPLDRLMQLGLVCQHPDELEPLNTCASVAGWTEVLGPLVGRRMFELGPNRVVRALRARTLFSGLQEELAVRAQP